MTFNLRLNDYELTLLRWLAEQRDESMQRVAKRLLIPALERLAANASPPQPNDAAPGRTIQHG